MDDELRARLDALEKKVDATFKAASAARTYLLWSGIVTCALVVLPVIGLVFAIPSFLDTYSSVNELLQP